MSPKIKGLPKKRTFKTVLLLPILQPPFISDSSSQDMNGGWRIGRSSAVLKVRFFFGTPCTFVEKNDKYEVCARVSKAGQCFNRFFSLLFPTISTKAMVITTIPSNIPGQEFSTKLCATRKPIFMKFYQPPYFIKKIILTNRSRVNDPLF